jgi:hypothetical protein
LKNLIKENIDYLPSKLDRRKERKQFQKGPEKTAGKRGKNEKSK